MHHRRFAGEGIVPSSDFTLLPTILAAVDRIWNKSWRDRVRAPILSYAPAPGANGGCSMEINHKLLVALVAAVAVGGILIRVQAQVPPAAYVVVEISEVTDAEGFKAVPAMTSPETLLPFGGKYLIRTEAVTALDGTAPKRFVVIAFPSVAQANAWKGSQSSKDVDVIRHKTTKSIQFMVEGP
jgi:uncharacterized protein (DUF1330 family)